MLEQEKNEFEKVINQKPLMIFIKGTPDAPMCRFSAHTVSVLNELGAEYGSFNIFDDENIRQGLKVYSNWPTFPQIYFKGKLLGGDDIITEMFESGELAELIKN